MPDSPDINAGAWYLRAAGERSWEVCEPVTGEVRAQVMATGDPAATVMATGNPAATVMATGNPAATVTATGDPVAAAAGAEAVARFLVQLVAEPRQGLGQ